MSNNELGTILELLFATAKHSVASSEREESALMIFSYLQSLFVSRMAVECFIYHEKSPVEIVIRLIEVSDPSERALLVSMFAMANLTIHKGSSEAVDRMIVEGNDLVSRVLPICLFWTNSQLISHRFIGLFVLDPSRGRIVRQDGIPGKYIR